MICVCDAGGDNIRKENFYCSYLVGDDLHSRIPIQVRSTNEAEYVALILLLECILRKRISEAITIKSDSKLVVQQVNGRWRISSKNLLPYYLKAIGLLESIRNTGIRIELMWVSRKEIVPVLGH
jgi:ribonuclease HI